ncbi:MAG: hypothetical protein NZ899_00380 [Thermoguttaceae bacterium]|nr:hypothetical protein [Thermoguttaceae bacterium]MDW8077352.1 hypothetical protein [Thermoguttaceae bacterium]
MDKQRGIAQAPAGMIYPSKCLRLFLSCSLWLGLGAWAVPDSQSLGLQETSLPENSAPQSEKASVLAQPDAQETGLATDVHKAWTEALNWLEGQAGGASAPGGPSGGLPQVPPEDPEERLRILAEAFAAFNAQAQKAWLLWSYQRPEGEATALELLEGDQLPITIRASLATLHALWLVRENRLDEALELLEKLPAEAGVAPETVLYCRAIVNYFLGRGPEACRCAEALLSYRSTLPARYRVIAQTICAEAPRWERNRLRHVCQLMGDVARRLALAREDPRLLPEQDEILKMLDQMIEEASRRRKKMQGVAAGSIRSQAPAQESLPLGGKGAGDVAPRTLGGKSDWGTLPPKDREEALQVIGRTFPPQYRQVIEQYFRRLAEEPAPAERPKKTTP